MVLAIGLLANTDAHPGVGRLPLASGLAQPTASASAETAFPNAAEQALLARLDSSIASFCRRAATGDVPPIDALPPPSVKTPYYVDPGPLARVPIEAGLRCTLAGSAPDVLFLWGVAPTYRGDATADRFFFARVSGAVAPQGDCATDKNAHMLWSFGPLTGKLLCVTTPATAERDDADRAALYQWWLDEGRSILH